MLKKYTLAIATIALTFAPVAAFAGEVQVNSQDAKNSAAAVGSNNTVMQDTQQIDIQGQSGVNAYPYGNGTTPQTQINKQDANNTGVAAGDGNTVIQQIEQESTQQQLSH